MNNGKVHMVTGAFGYLGSYIAKRLLDLGITVKTVTNSYHRDNPFAGKIEAHKFNFDNPELLIRSLEGVEVFYNTYWVRFNHPSFTHESAVINTRRLFDAAKSAGVKRFVHVSITNPSLDSDLEYFNGKARLEQKLMESGISYSIIRPAVLFGGKDILVNNIAWGVRTFPVIGTFGDGSYRLQPIHVDDLAAIAVAEGASRENRILDAIGPETFTYRGLIETISGIIGIRRPIIPVPPMVAYYSLKLAGLFLGDIIVTKEEIVGLMRELLYVKSPPLGTTKLTDWANRYKEILGTKYASELERRRDLKTSYDKIG